MRDNLFTIRVDDCQVTYELLRARGGEFLTPPVTNGSEIRCFLRDPDGHLFELSEYRTVRGEGRPSKRLRRELDRMRRPDPG